jgi:hypothetical protein
VVEVALAIIERQALRRGDFASVEELMAVIRRFCDGGNQRWHPFTWTKDANQILTKLKRQTPQQRTTTAVHRPLVIGPGSPQPGDAPEPSARLDLAWPARPPARSTREGML